MQLTTATSLATFCAGRFEECTRLAEKVVREMPTFLPAWRIMSAGYALSGLADQANRAMMKVLELDPVARVSVVALPARFHESAAAVPCMARRYCTRLRRSRAIGLMSFRLARAYLVHYQLQSDGGYALATHVPTIPCEIGALPPRSAAPHQYRDLPARRHSPVREPRAVAAGRRGRGHERHQPARRGAA